MDSHANPLPYKPEHATIRDKATPGVVLIGGTLCPKPLLTEYRTRLKTSRFAGLSSDGANRDRTGDLLLAKQALSQLSYGPWGPNYTTCKADFGWAPEARRLINPAPRTPQPRAPPSARPAAG